MLTLLPVPRHCRIEPDKQIANQSQLNLRGRGSHFDVTLRYVPPQLLPVRSPRLPHPGGDHRQ